MIDEGARFRLHRRLSEALGEEPAVTLMSHLPPSGWADVATRHDVDGLRQEVLAVEARLGGRIDRLGERQDRLEERMDRLGERMDRLEERIDSKVRVFIGTTIAAVFSSVLATAAIVFGAVSL